jgi:hypothetical protein
MQAVSTPEMLANFCHTTMREGCQLLAVINLWQRKPGQNRTNKKTHFDAGSEIIKLIADSP